MTEQFVQREFNTLAEVVHTFKERGSLEAIRYFNGFRIFRFSYAEIYDLSQRCVVFMHEWGLQKGDRVLIWAPNSPEWAVVFCACAISGVILVPLDIRNTPEFAEAIGRETEAKLLFRTQFKKDPDLPLKSIVIENLFDSLYRIKPTLSLDPVTPDETIEIVYTSGTTGAPKGVVLTQQNIAVNLSDVLKVVPIDQTYHLLSVLPLSHALEQTAGFWTPLAGGGTITYIQMLKPSTLFEVFHRVPITAMVLVPRLLSLLKQGIENQMKEKHLESYLRFGLALYPKFPRSVRKLYFYPIHKRFNPDFHVFVSGGSALDAEVEKFWNAIGFEVLQGYGLTETSPVLTATRPGKTRISSVGYTMEHVDIQLGEDKEILAKGENIFPGYYKKPELNPSVFQDGWFKTGDIGEFDEDGYLYIRTRKKDIIVTSDGVNVYPEDIEGVLNHQPEVKESCVIGIGPQEEEVHAVMIPHDRTVDLDRIIQRANEKLSPEQQIRSYDEWPEDEFPKTTTLKIKKNEVRKRLDQGEKGKPASNRQEGSKLQKILSEIAETPVDQLTPETRIGQDLGLSSIQRVELITRIEETFRIDMDDNVVTADATIQQIEDSLNRQKQGQTDLVFRRWTRLKPVQALRSVFEKAVMFPLTRAVTDVEIVGQENLENLKGPLFIVANHTSHIDTALVKMLLPRPIGKRVCPAAWKEYFDTAGLPIHMKIAKWLAWNFSTIFVNLFPFPHKAGVRKSMMYGGELLDDGWSILLFPEGERSQTGELITFHEGVGVMFESYNLPQDIESETNITIPAQGNSLIESRRIPLLPVAIVGGERILGRGKALPKRGRIKVAFGSPFFPQPGNYAVVTEDIRQKIISLRNHLLHIQ